MQNEGGILGGGVDNNRMEGIMNKIVRVRRLVLLLPLPVTDVHSTTPPLSRSMGSGE